MMNKVRTYYGLMQLQSYEERFQYLKLDGSLGSLTFGFDRYLNQSFYTSVEWKRVRNEVVVRDNACDLGISDRQLHGKIFVHHMNPITLEDIERSSDILLLSKYLITTSHVTHNAIHFGNEKNLVVLPRERTKGDTILW